MGYSFEEVKKVVDKFVVVLVGAPRGVDTLTWIRGVPEQLKRTMYDDSSNKTKNINIDNWGHHPTNKPEFHVCCVTNLYDSVDRYMKGEDHTLSGLSDAPYIDYEDINKRESARRSIENILRTWNDECFLNFRSKTYGKKSIHKEKWEKYITKQFEWCDSVNFSYSDTYELLNDWIDKSNRIELNRFYPEGIQWANQYVHMVQAYNDNKDLFDSLTENSVVLRMRWDMRMDYDTTMWNFARIMFQTHWGNQTSSGKQHSIHHHGFTLHPMVLGPQVSILRGHLSIRDYWHCFDGIGAQVLGKRWNDWMWENPMERLPNLHAIDWDKDINRKTNYWKYPDSVIMDFLIDEGYTVVDASKSGSPINNVLMSFDTLLTDQYRYEFYGWTLEEVQQIIDNQRD